MNSARASKKNRSNAARSPRPELSVVSESSASLMSLAEAEATPAVAAGGAAHEPIADQVIADQVAVEAVAVEAVAVEAPAEQVAAIHESTVAAKVEELVEATAAGADPLEVEAPVEVVAAVEPELTVEPEEPELAPGPVNYDEPGLFELEKEGGLYRFDAGKQGTALCLSHRAPGSWRWGYLGELRWDGRDLRSKALERKLLGELSLELRRFMQESAQ